MEVPNFCYADGICLGVARLDVKKNFFLLAATVLVCFTQSVQADDTYLLGFGAAVDSAEGVSVTALVDYSFNTKASLALDAGITRADGDPEVLNTTLWNLEFSYDFGLIGVKTAIGQWGDSDEYTSDSVAIGLFRQIGNWRISADYLHRDLNLTFRQIQNPETTRTVSARSTGTSVDIVYTGDSGRAFFLSAVQFDYNKDVTRLNQFRIARLLSPTSLTLSGSLLDHSVSAGAEWPFSDSGLSLSFARDRTATDGEDIDSLMLNWLTPIGDLTDLDIGVGMSQDGDDTQYFVSLLFLRYGGID